jgi:hypothetical protein
LLKAARDIVYKSLCQKKSFTHTKKSAGGIAQVKALSSSPRAAKKGRKLISSANKVGLL